jgi:UDP-4-amino-4,6-dideoxy-N-acetyl-beta-L-altrosamine N-acetyltransferase
VIVQFRPLEPEDGDQVLAWRNSPDVAAYMYADQVITASEHALWLEAALTKDDRRYWVIEADGMGVGVANLAHIDRTVRRCELGHYIADPQMRGKGVGACVEYILLQQVFEVLKLNKLWCEAARKLWLCSRGPLSRPRVQRRPISGCGGPWHADEGLDHRPTRLRGAPCGPGV